ncbi:MAG TPA: anti-sigma factor [Streptosporangiaceae bacterium]|nr:anti-sigma factor [Streptosporangiaceae bacterium]
MTTSDDFELHTLAGPFAMDAVTAEERASFAAHQDDCHQCRDDVREMREATARLGIAAAVRPRPELREQTIRAALRTSQLAPEILGEPAAAQEPAPTSEEGPATAKAKGSVLRQLAGRVRPNKTLAMITLAAAALIIGVAGGYGLVANDVSRQLHHTQTQDHAIDAVLNAPDAVMMTSQVSTGGVATVVMSHREHSLVFSAHGLAALPGGRAYELWLMGPSGERPAGMLKPDPGGMAGPAVVSGLAPGDMIGLTIEPARGAPQPTSALIVAIGPHR